MCPNAGYRIGHEKGAGKNGNAPFLLYDFLPMELAFFAVPFVVGQAYSLTIKIPLTITGILSWLAEILAIAVTIQIAFQAVLRYRYRNPYTNSELEHLITRVQTHMGISKNVQLWEYSSIKPVLVPLSGIFFRSLVISKPAEEDLLASSEMAELVLADHLESMNRGLLLSTWLPIVSLVLLASLFVRWTGLTPEQAVGIPWLFYWGIVILSAKQLLFGKEDKVNTVLETYGTHPDVARCIVFRGSAPTEAEMKDISKQPINPLSKDANRTKSYFAFFGALVISLIIGTLLSSWILNLKPTPFQILNDFLIVLPMLISLSVFMGLFFYATRITYEYPEQPLNQTVPKFDKT
jgi:hypothetical protein